MKRYLWTGVAILCIGLEASDNPFDLKTNLKNLDEEQSRLISELRESSSGDTFLLDGEIDAEESKTESIELADQNGSLPPESAEAIPHEKAEETQADAKEPKPGEVAESQGTVMAEEQKKAEEARLKALEEERIAVEKYEAERLRKKHSEEAKHNTEPKKQKETFQETVKAEAEPEQSLDIEKAMEQAKEEVEQPQMPKDTASTQKSTEGRSAPHNIHLSPEAKEAKEAADRLYRDAIKEVDAE
ncbi:MAG: hypothetical protein PHO65_02005 [Sulfurovum sp.]|nr:hypothetical protein [Sulfurovum sp.]